MPVGTPTDVPAVLLQALFPRGLCLLCPRAILGSVHPRCHSSVLDMEVTFTHSSRLLESQLPPSLQSLSVCVCETVGL